MSSPWGWMAALVVTSGMAPGAMAQQGTITACVSKGNGSARFVNLAADCKNNETAISWNIVGPEGPQGIQGPQGAQGPQGVQGNTGAQGLKGDTGAQGVKGDTGAQGLKGDIGAQGLKGDIGAQGLKGDTGAQGLKGDTGAQGLKGDTGAQGLKGDTGAQGLKGDTGAQGLKGDTGAQGLKGDTGAQGLKGDTGAQGLKGDTGAQGAQGLKGDTGAQGLKGDTGAQGLKGDAGAQGLKGDTGLQGPKGDAGAQGPAGTSGAAIVANFNCASGTFLTGFNSAGQPLCGSVGPGDVVFQWGTVTLGPTGPQFLDLDTGTTFSNSNPGTSDLCSSSNLCLGFSVDSSATQAAHFANTAPTKSECQILAGYQAGFFTFSPNPAVGEYYCVRTNGGHIATFVVNSYSGLPGNPTVNLTFTTWQ